MPKSIHIYEKDGRFSSRPIKYGVRHSFFNVEQAVNYGKARNAHKDDIANKIENTNANDYRENPNIFKEETEGIPDTEQWESKKRQWEKMAVKAKFAHDDFAKSTRDTLKSFNLIDANDKRNEKGRLLKQALTEMQNYNVTDDVKLTKTPLEQQTANPFVSRPKYQKVQRFNCLLGKTSGNIFSYSAVSTPNSPLNDNYVTKHNFDLYLGGGKMSSKRHDGAKAYHFSSVDQVVAFGLAHEAHNDFALTDIYNTNPDYARTHKDVYETILANTPTPPNWDKKKLVWQKVGQEAKFDQDEFAKDALNIARKYNVVNKYNPEEGQMINSVARVLEQRGTFGQEVQKDDSLQNTQITQGDNTLQNIADSEPQQEQKDDTQLSLW